MLKASYIQAPGHEIEKYTPCFSVATVLKPCLSNVQLSVTATQLLGALGTSWTSVLEVSTSYPGNTHLPSSLCSPALVSQA